jgi:uncharacterized protein (UPF0261 family)
VRKSIVIIRNLDTRGENILFVKDLIRTRGHEPLLIDFSMDAPPAAAGDVPCEEVARRGGLPIDEMRGLYRTDRQRATDNQIAGVTAIVADLTGRGRVHGVIGIGGATSALVATSVMQKLPFGLPKLMASRVAAHPRYVGSFVGTRDIVMHNTVLDVVKMNALLKTQIVNAVGAICGMVEANAGAAIRFKRPAVAVSSFGLAEMAAQAVVTMLEQAGFEPVVFHAQGVGDRAMEEMIDEGLFAGVLDLCIGGVIENLYGGNRDPGPNRLTAAARRGLPVVLASCRLDMLSLGGRPDRLEVVKTRARYVQDSMRVQVRTSVDELQRAADVVAERLNAARGPFVFLIPTRGWSSLDRGGGPMRDRLANEAFVEWLTQRLREPSAMRDVDLHFYTPEFARRAVDEFTRLHAQAATARPGETRATAS